MEIHRDEQGWPLPPWLAYPDIPQGSIGWRMGAGEDYIYGWGDWYNAQSPQVCRAYRERYPASKGWALLYDKSPDGEEPLG